MGLLMGPSSGLARTLPKSLTPLVQMRCDPAAEQALRRFAGWSPRLRRCLRGGFALAHTSAMRSRWPPRLLGPPRGRTADRNAVEGRRSSGHFRRPATAHHRGEEGHGRRRQLAGELEESAGPGAINLDPAYDGGDLPSDKDAPVVSTARTPCAARRQRGPACPGDGLSQRAGHESRHQGLGGEGPADGIGRVSPVVTRAQKGPNPPEAEL